MSEVKEFRHTEFCMGTVFRFVGRTDLDTTKAIDEAVAILHEADNIFSLYKQDSPLSKLARGETSVADCDPVVSDIWDLCEKWTEETEGWFTAFTAEHTFDPSGVVKTWAANLAAEKLEKFGITDFAMNAGGDIRLSKEITPGFAMRIGISTPVTIAAAEAGVLTVVDLNDSNYRAVATSGTAERGEHIWNPKTNSWANQLAQVTVVAEGLVSADVWATALFAAGDQALTFAERHGVQALFVDLEGTLSSTKGFTELLRPV